jgi:hypothetical protein
MTTAAGHVDHEHPRARSQLDLWLLVRHFSGPADPHHSLGWLIDIDPVMQANRTFASFENVDRWLRRKTDAAAFDRRIAMLCRRHHAGPQNAMRKDA